MELVTAGALSPLHLALGKDSCWVFCCWFMAWVGCSLSWEGGAHSALCAERTGAALLPQNGGSQRLLSSPLTLT